MTHDFYLILGLRPVEDDIIQSFPKTHILYSYLGIPSVNATLKMIGAKENMTVYIIIRPVLRVCLFFYSSKYPFK